MSSSTPIRLAELAERLELELRGRPDDTVSGLATLSGAGPGDVSFLANPRYRGQLQTTGASAVIVPESAAEACPGNALISPNPYASWARAAALLRPEPKFEPGVHPTAAVDPRADVHCSAQVGAHASIGAESRVGPDCVIGPGSVVAGNVEIGAGCRLVARVYVGPEVRIGQRVLIHPGAVIGADGFGLAMESGHWLKVPQLGGVRIGDDCEIGANTTIDRGAIDDTVLGCDVRLDNQVQIAHNVRIGDHTAVAGCVGIAGSTTIGKYCMIAGACGIGGHLEICDRAVITAMSTVLDSITEPGEYGSGIPARPKRAWQRILVRLGRLESMARRLNRLEKKQNRANSK